MHDIGQGTTAKFQVVVNSQRISVVEHALLAGCNPADRHSRWVCPIWDSEK